MKIHIIVPVPDDLGQTLALTIVAGRLDGQAIYATVPITRELLADRLPEALDLLDAEIERRGLARDRSGNLTPIIGEMARPGRKALSPLAEAVRKTRETR